MRYFLKNKRLFCLIIILTIVKIAFVCCVNSGGLNWNPDEDSNYNIASNYLKGLGYTIFDPKTNSYKQKAYHNSFTVFIYIFLQRIGLSKGHWALFIHSLATVLYSISILYFYKTVKLFFKNKSGCLIATLLYGLYPSLIYFIGTLFFYENIVVPILVIVMYKLVKYSIDPKIRWYEIIMVPVLVAISCLVRTQVIFVYFVIFITFFIIEIPMLIRNRKLIWMLLITASLTLLVHAPILKKNKVMFGSYILSTQLGNELLRGHNPFARGSSGRGLPKLPNPNSDDLNAYERSLVARDFAISWILNNPLGEVKLAMRKIAIYFLPQNYNGSLPGNRIYNPINLIVHLLFMTSFVFTLVRFRALQIRKEDILILSPIIASILLSLIFFVGYRWRYYAEPFMIIYIFLFIQRIKDVRCKSII